MKEDEVKFIKKTERFELAEANPGPSTSRYHPRENTTGILRTDSRRPRHSSGSSVEFRTPTWLPTQVRFIENIMCPDIIYWVLNNFIELIFNKYGITYAIEKGS